MERERRRAEAAEYQAHQRSIQEWEAQIEARGLDNAAIPCGPTPARTSSVRVLPNVHAALRQNDPKMASFSQPAVKKAPPTSGRPMPSVFRSDAEPPRIGTSPVQPPPPAAPRPVDASSARLPLAPTPMTPSHPPRPPIEALLKVSFYGDKFLCQQASIGATDSTGSTEQACSMQGVSTFFSASRSGLYGSNGSN